MNRATDPKPLTGRTVLFVLVAFFGVVIGVNLIMMKFAIQSLPGTEVDSAYRASLAYEREIAAARDQSARNWKVDARVRRSADGGRNAAGGGSRQQRPADVRPEIPGTFRAANRQAGRPSRCAGGSRAWNLSGDRGRYRLGTMGSGAGRRCGGSADVPVEKSCAAGLGRHPSMQATTRDFSHYVRAAGAGLVPYRPCGRRRQLRRMHVQDRARALFHPRRHAGACQPDGPPCGAGMARGRARSGAVRRPARRARL